MAKFETIKTAMYQYLVDELEEEIAFAEQRVEILTQQDDLESAISEEKQLMKDREKLLHLKSYLEEESKCTCNVPHYIEISHFNRYANKITTEDLNCHALDEAAFNYYYTSSGIKLKDWRNLEEGVEYIFNNLTIKRDGDKLMSIYPQERMWYELNENFDSDQRIFKQFGDKDVYIKHK